MGVWSREVGDVNGKKDKIKRKFGLKRGFSIYYLFSIVLIMEHGFLFAIHMLK